MSTPELDLELATKWMSTISLFLLIFLGLFGCLCNIITFTSKKLKGSSCAFYFLCTALFEAFILSFGGISQLATDHFSSPFLNQNRIFCKTRPYLMTATSTIASLSLLMAAVDRYMTTSIHVRYRAFCQMKIAYRVVLITIVLTLVFNIRALIFFDLQPIFIPQPGVYALFYSIYVIFAMERCQMG